jgi:hypothetical protein
MVITDDALVRFKLRDMLTLTHTHSKVEDCVVEGAREKLPPAELAEGRFV